MQSLLQPSELGLDFDGYWEGQPEAIVSILRQFEDGKSVVFLDAPPGAGKSLITMAISCLLRKSSIITTMTKQLGRQYRRDFEEKIVVMEGRSNFRCALQPEFDVSEGLCQLPEFECSDKYSICPYYIRKREAMGSPCVCTNIAYFLNEANYTDGKVCSNRHLLVIDEGHTLENALMSFVAIQLSRSSFRRAGVTLPNLSDVAQARDWARESYSDVDRVARHKAGTVGKNPTKEQMKELLRFNRAAARLRQLATIEPSDWSLVKTRTGYELKPYFIDKLVAPLVMRHAEKVLLMSATFLSKRVMTRILGLDPETVGWYQMGSTFPPDNRPFNYVPVTRVNRKAGDQEYSRLASAVDMLLERHADEKGVVHTTSYKVRDQILNHSRYRRRFVTHSSSKERDSAIDTFLHAKEPRVLLSPSVGLGLDLHDDLCRFQIVAKVPYLNLGDPQIRFRQKKDPGWYAWAAVAAIVQMYGRSTRHKHDYSTTYMLDSSFSRLLESNTDLFPVWWKEAYHSARSVEQTVIARGGSL